MMFVNAYMWPSSPSYSSLGHLALLVLVVRGLAKWPKFSLNLSFSHVAQSTGPLGSPPGSLKSPTKQLHPRAREKFHWDKYAKSLPRTNQLVCDGFDERRTNHTPM